MAKRLVFFYTDKHVITNAITYLKCQKSYNIKLIQRFGTFICKAVYANCELLNTNN